MQESERRIGGSGGVLLCFLRWRKKTTEKERIGGGWLLLLAMEKQREIDRREGSGRFGWKKKNGRGALSAVCLAVEEEKSRREVAAAGVKEMEWN